MGPWQIRDPGQPFKPGCSFDVIKGLIARGKIVPSTVLRGPTTRQFWTPAKRVPSIANLLGKCHNCEMAVSPTAAMCQACGTSFDPEQDRQYLGLMPVRLLPGQASADVVAASALGAGVANPVSQVSPMTPARSIPSDPAAVQAQSAESARIPNTEPSVVEPFDLDVGEDLPAPMGRGFKATLIIFIVGTVAVMSVTLFVTLAPMAGVELPDWVPTFSKLSSNSQAAGSEEIVQGQPQPMKATASSAEQDGTPSSPALQPNKDETDIRDLAVKNEAADSGLDYSVTITQIRSLLAVGTESAIDQAIVRIEELPSEAEIAAVLLRSAEDLKLMRAIVGTL